MKISPLALVIASLCLPPLASAEHILRRGQNEVKGTRHGDMFVPCTGQPFKILSSDTLKETVEKCETRRPVITGHLKLVRIDVDNGTATVVALSGEHSFPLPDDRIVLAKLKKLNAGVSVPVKMVDHVPFKIDEESLK